MKNSGQAALEFLTTYGWALLAAGAAIGALYFLVLTPETVVSPSCNIYGELECVGFRINGTANEVGFELRNNAGRIINITRVDCEVNGVNENISPNMVVSSGGTSGQINCIFSPGVITGTLINANVVIYYKLDNMEFPKSVEGLIIDRIHY